MLGIRGAARGSGGGEGFTGRKRWIAMRLLAPLVSVTATAPVLEIWRSGKRGAEAGVSIEIPGKLLEVERTEMG